MKSNRVVSQEEVLSAGSSGTAESAERVLVIERIFDAPPSLVFKAWTDPQHLVHWFGPRGFTLPSCELDLRPGGAWRSCMLSGEGREHWVRGVFREIVEPERIVYRNAPSTGPAWKGNPPAIYTKTLHTVGIGESDLDRRIEDLFRTLENPKIAVLAHEGLCDVKLMAKAQTREAGEALIAPLAHEIRGRLRAHIFGENGERLGTVMEWSQRTQEVRVERELHVERMIVAQVGAGIDHDWQDIGQLRALELAGWSPG